MSPEGRWVGRPIAYAVTIPANATCPDEARIFVDFILDAFREEKAGWPVPAGEGPDAAIAYHATE